jgi:hypothetical protein
MKPIAMRFIGHTLRLGMMFVLCTLGVFGVYYAPLQPKSPWLAIIGETATPDQLAIVHRQIDPGPHSFLPRYLHWVSGLYLPIVIPAILVLAAVAAVSLAHRRTPHDTDPKASVAVLLSGTWA